MKTDKVQTTNNLAKLASYVGVHVVNESRCEIFSMRRTTPRQL